MTKTLRVSMNKTTNRGIWSFASDDGNFYPISAKAGEWFQNNFQNCEIQEFHSLREARNAGFEWLWLHG